MEIGKLYSIRLYHSNEEFKGIVQSIGNEWIVLYQLFTDFMMDGYLLLKKEYINTIVHDEKNSFTEKVLLAKGVAFNRLNFDIPLDDTKALFQWLKEREIVFMFSLRDTYAGHVGKISRILPQSFYLHVLDVDGVWREELLYRINTVRSIDFDSDYIKSLLMYCNSNLEK